MWKKNDTLSLSLSLSLSLKCNVINLPIPKQPGVEDLWVSVQYHMLPAIIIECVYRKKANYTFHQWVT